MNIHLNRCNEGSSFLFSFLFCTGKRWKKEDRRISRSRRCCCFVNSTYPESTSMLYGTGIEILGRGTDLNCLLLLSLLLSSFTRIAFLFIYSNTCLTVITTTTGNLGNTSSSRVERENKIPGGPLNRQAMETPPDERSSSSLLL
jgi:hypothetical protein